MEFYQENNDDYSDPFSLSLKNDNASTYYGIQSVADKSTTHENQHTDYKKKNNINNNIEPITFEWPEEEKESEIVYLTGNFCNWKQFLIMPKKDKNYSLTLPLPRGLHQFRFRINNVWKVNKKYPTMKDGDNENNYVDTSLPSTNIESQAEKNCNNEEDSNDDNEDNEEDEKKEFSSESDFSESFGEDDEEDEEELQRRRWRKIRKSLKKMKYSVYYPKKKDYSRIAPDIPYSYNYKFNLDLNTKQINIGRNKFNENENDLMSGNYSYKKINVLPLVELNHIHSKENNANKTNMCSLFFRYRNKFTSFLYYKPKK